eukprot:Nitzschia sp. Nitz4//scaffold362_size15054//7244//8048//NITZ4_008901-RA/size15054-snap-gene-0.1-mRNA-1//-1//CDS//3329549247//1286//frame0
MEFEWHNEVQEIRHLRRESNQDSNTATSTPREDHPQESSPHEDRDDLPKVPDILIARKLLSVSSIEIPREQAEKFLPKYSRRCQGTISVLGEATLLCFSEPIATTWISGEDGNDPRNYVCESFDGDIEMGSQNSNNTDAENEMAISSNVNLESLEIPTIPCRPMEDTKEASQHDEVKPPDTSCSICCEEYQTEDFVVWSRYNLDCPHAFHHHCLLQWLKRSEHCPVCRRSYN